MTPVAPIGHNNPPSEMDIVLERLSQKEQTIRQGMKFPDAPAVITDEHEAGRITDIVKGVKTIVTTVSDTHEAVKKPYLECGRAVDAWKKRLEAELSAISLRYTAPLTAFLERRAQEERQRQIDAARVERTGRGARIGSSGALRSRIADTADELMNAAVNTEIMAERMEQKVHTATPSQLTRTRSVFGATASQRLVWVGEIKNISAVDLEKLRPYFTLDELQKVINAFIRNGGRELDGVIIEQRAQLAVR